MDQRIESFLDRRSRGRGRRSAARLQRIAKPATVAIAESTRKLIGNHLQDLGAKDLKGIGAPMRAWAVCDPPQSKDRFEALHASGLTELVGREEELELQHGNRRTP